MVAASRTTVLTLCGAGESYRQAPTVSALPDNVLLGIFDSCRNDHPDFYPVWDWHILVHVCRRWRQVVFASPHSLNLKILCTCRTPVRTHLGIWPAFPIVIDYHDCHTECITPDDEDNIVAALESEHLDRICFIELGVTGLQLRMFAAMMQEPLPALNQLLISLEDGDAPALPDGFLGGSAPCLQKINLDGVPYPALPTLLLSASGLVELMLYTIPRTGYISPEAMVASLAALPKLERFCIAFQWATPLPDRLRPPPTIRTVLPVLSLFDFKGVNTYLEDLVSRIDCPQLIKISVVYLDPPVHFPVTQLIDFIDRSVGQRSTIFRRAHVAVFNHHVALALHHHSYHPRSISTTTTPEAIEWQFTHMVQVLTRISATLSNVVHLELRKGPQFGSMVNSEWQGLLQQFSAVQTLKLCSELANRMARTLQDITNERVVGLFPSLELICLQDQPDSSIEKIVALRKLSGHPVTVVNTETEFDKIFESYMKQEIFPYQLRTL